MVIARVLALCLLCAPAFAGPDRPQRVVSINLCTDQLAMLLAAPGQLVAVSPLAQDPASSVMADAARAYPTTTGLAEDVYLLQPDLVLAGSFSAQTTVSMLQRLGIPVAVFPPAYGLADVRQGMLDMGRALGRDEAAAELVAAYDAGLAQLPAAPEPRPTAATYAANGYSAGAGSLSGEIIEAAGLHHLAADLGLPHGGSLPLEALVLADPDLLVMEPTHPGHARAEEVLTHPALRALGGGQAAMQDRDWVCGLPSVLDAIDRLAAARQAVSP
ncbi:iron complex transport system substrate-binding protein [Gemmobacter aquatilis]|uniref:Iron complex transport system substrate-binding protein n=1 Tax=Gemmobacter aquatilis TaxID=933059 RepID=A0A1H8DNP4_9RHOB|nr:ABC transporter substrate-binding protein [Gemmobacter aquatilis]SEN08775.1 iron complex transport system substrate-binding protein [Gemmobacter aquatilis]